MQPIVIPAFQPVKGRNNGIELWLSMEMLRLDLEYPTVAVEIKIAG
jgi:hypothetical protein